MSKIARCRRCRRPEEIVTRGMSKHCYERVRYAGRLHEYPRMTRTLTEFADDFTILDGRGLSFLQIAERLGYTPASLERNIFRARKEGLLPRTKPSCGWGRKLWARAR